MRECDEIGWQSWELVNEEQRERFEVQLRMEVRAGHPLYEAVERLKVIARDGASDDILVADFSCPDKTYVVHLCWSNGTGEDTLFPSTCSMSKSVLPPEYQ